MGVWPASADRGLRPIRRGTVRPIGEAAARAASRTGTEVSPPTSPADAGGAGPGCCCAVVGPPEIPTPEQAEESAEAPVTA